MEIRDLALLDISNVLTNLEKLETSYKATGARLGSKVRLDLDTVQAFAQLQELEKRVAGLRGRNVPITLGAGAAAAEVSPHLSPESIKLIESQVKGLAERLNNTLMLSVRLKFEGTDPLSGLVSTIMRTVQAIEDLNVTLSAAGKITTTYREQAQSVDSVVVNLARAIKLLALEQKNGKIDADLLTAGMTALRTRVTELSASAALGSQEAVILGQAYRTASAALGEAAKKASPLGESIEMIRVKVAGLRAGFQSGTIGEQEFILKARELVAEGKALNVTLESDVVAFKNLQIALRPATAAIDALEGKMSRLGLASQVGLGLGRTNQLLSGFASSLGFLPGPLGLIATYAQTASASLQGLSVAEIAAAAPAIALGVAIVGLAAAFGIGLHDAADFEKALDQVGAIGSLTRPELEHLGRSFLDLSTVVPVTAKDLTEFSRQAETLGIHGAEGLQNYVDVMSNLKLIIRDVDGGAAGLEHTGQEMVKFLRSVDSKDINGDLKVTANTLVDLKTKFGAAIPSVVGLATYFSSGAKGAGATNEQILALSAALVSVGARPQSAGSSLARLFVNIQGAVNGNEKSARAWSAALGLNVEDFKRLGRESPAEAIKLFSERLAEATAKGIPLSSIYATLGIKGQQYTRTVNELALAHDRLGEAYDVANAGAKDTDALQRRARDASQNFNDQVQLLKNSFYKLGVEIGDHLLPTATAVVKFFIDALNGAHNLAEYGPTLATAIGVITAAYALQSKTLKGLLELEALQGGRALFAAAGNGLTTLSTTLRNLPALFRGAAGATAELDATLGAGASGGLGTFLRALAAIPVASAAALAGIVLLAGGVAVYGLKIAADTRAAYDDVEQAGLDAQQKLIAKATALAAQGPLGKLKAKQLLTISLRYESDNTPETNAALDAKLAGLKLQIAAQEKLDAASKKSAEIARENIKPTEAQVVAYQDLEDKLVALSQKYGQDKLTPFQTGVAAARKEVDSLTDSIQKAIDKGQLSERQGEGLMGQAGAIATRAVSELTRRQLDEDALALRGHERDIQNGLTGLIQDARAKRSATLDGEIQDIATKYAPLIKAALQNAQTAPAGQKGAFTREAGQLQNQQAQEEVIARRKASEDLDQIDRDRASKVRQAQQTLLGEQQKGLASRTALLVQEQQAAVTGAGESLQGQVEASRRYAPLILAAKQNELQATSQAARAQAQTDLESSLRDAQTAGSRQGELELSARQTYLQRVRNANETASNEYEVARLASVKELQDREAAVVKESVGQQLQDTASLTGRELAKLAGTYRTGLSAAAAAGNQPVLAAYREALKQVASLQEAAVKSFRSTSGEAEKTISDLSKKLRDAQPVSERTQGERQARQPFDEVIRGGQEALKKLRDDFGQLSSGDQTGARLQRYLADTRTLEGQVRQARADSNAASLRSDLAYNAKRVQDGNAATTALRQGELTLAQSRGQLAEKQARTDAEVLASRQNLITLAGKELVASEQALGRLSGERAAALAGAGTPEERRRVADTYAERSLSAQNDLVGKRSALYDAVQSKVQAQLAIDTRALGTQDAQNKLLEARTPLAQRALLTAQLEVESGQAALANAQKALTTLRSSGAGREAVAAQELAVTSAQTDLLAKREGLEQAITAEVDKRVATQQLELDLSQARQRANAQISGAADDAVASARLDLDLTRQNLEANQRQQVLLRGRRDQQDALLGLQKNEAELIGTQATQQRALTEALRDRQTLVESIQTSERGLQDASGERLQGTVLATRTLTEAREDLGASERRYAQALEDVGRSQNQTTLGAYKTATDDLTSRISAQQAAVQGLADAYRSQIGEMDGVRSATERLAEVVRGKDTGQIKQGDVNVELDRLRAIQTRRDDALDRVQQAIASGDEKRIQAATTDLSSQEDRYRKQFERVTKGTGIQLSLTNEGEVVDTLKRLEQLGVTYDQLTPELQKRADAADTEAKSVTTLDAAIRTFAPSADRLAAALSNPSIFAQGLLPIGPGTTALPTSATGMSNYRGGDTITINIPITLDGQPVPTPEEFRRIARSEIAGAIQDARRSQAWEKGC